MKTRNVVLAAAMTVALGSQAVIAADALTLNGQLSVIGLQSDIADNDYILSGGAVTATAVNTINVATLTATAVAGFSGSAITNTAQLSVYADQGATADNHFVYSADNTEAVAANSINTVDATSKSEQQHESFAATRNLQINVTSDQDADAYNGYVYSRNGDVKAISQNLVNTGSLTAKSESDHRDAGAVVRSAQINLDSDQDALSYNHNIHAHRGGVTAQAINSVNSVDITARSKVDNAYAYDDATTRVGNSQFSLFATQDATAANRSIKARGDVTAVAGNSVNTATIVATSKVEDGSGHLNYSNDARTGVRSSQVSILTVQEADATNLDIRSGGDVDAVAVNSINSSDITAKSTNDGSHTHWSGSENTATTRVGNVQVSVLGFQEADATNRFIFNGHGSLDDVSAVAQNGINATTIVARANTNGSGGRDHARTSVGSLQLNGIAVQNADASNFVVIGGNKVGATAVNFVNISDITATADGGHVTTASALNGQVSVLAFQNATADNTLILASGDVSALALNAVNQANITVDADSSVGTSTATGVNLQGSFLTVQNASASNTGIATPGNVTATAANTINSATVNVTAH